MGSKILDCTLRDGSYTIGFSFNKQQTYKLVKKLGEVGVNFIEIGHGLGQGASKRTKYKAKCTDLEYLVSLKNIPKKIKWGVFCIPDIATHDDLKLAYDHGSKFFRIGSNLEKYKTQENFITFLKKRGAMVCSNLMKSYLLSPKEFAKLAIKMKNMGADLIYLVDSAGGMLPDEIKQYYLEVKNLDDKIKLGFHGHDNLGLANINALVAYELGFEIIDCSLQGIGRSAGNTVIEQFVSSLLRKNINPKIDLLKLIDFSEKFIVNKYHYRKIDSLDLIMGLRLFHSSYMGIIEKYSKKYKVDPREMIILCSKINRLSTDEKIAEKVAKKLAKSNKTKVWNNFYKKYFGGEQNLEKII